MESTIGFIVGPKKIPHNFFQTISDARWDSEQGCKNIGSLHKVLFNKVNLPPLDRRFGFHPANFLLNLSTTAPFIVFLPSLWDG